MVYAHFFFLGLYFLIACEMKMFLYRETFLPNFLSAFLLADLYALDFLLKDFGLPNLFGLALANIGFFLAITSSSFF
jgi:hypothetical protein